MQSRKQILPLGISTLTIMVLQALNSIGMKTCKFIHFFCSQRLLLMKHDVTISHDADWPKYACWTLISPLSTLNTKSNMTSLSLTSWNSPWQVTRQRPRFWGWPSWLYQLEQIRLNLPCNKNCLIGCSLGLYVYPFDGETMFEGNSTSFMG